MINVTEWNNILASWLALKTFAPSTNAPLPASPCAKPLGSLTLVTLPAVITVTFCIYGDLDVTTVFDAKLNAFAQDFADFYNIQDKFITQFLVVEPNKTLPWHADGKPASCCVNSLLTGGTAPIEFRQKSYQYDTALLNIRNEHRVVNGPDMRVMFRIVFYEETTTFETIRDKIHDKTFKI